LPAQIRIFGVNDWFLVTSFKGLDKMANGMVYGAMTEAKKPKKKFIRMHTWCAE